MATFILGEFSSPHLPEVSYLDIMSNIEQKEKKCSIKIW